MPQTRSFAQSPLTLTLGHFVAQHIRRTILVPILLALCLMAGGYANAQQFPAVAVNPVTNKVYIADDSDLSLKVLDGTTGMVSTISTAGGVSNVLAVNPVTNKIYVDSPNTFGITVVDGASGTATQVATNIDFLPVGIAVNPVTNTVYAFGEDLTVISGATSTQPATVVGTIDLGIADDVAIPEGIAVNPATNRLYVTSDDGFLRVVDPAASAVIAKVALCNPLPGAVDVNPATNKIYAVCNNPREVVVLDGASNTVVATIPLSGAQGGLAVNPVTNKIYVTGSDNNTVTVIDGSSNAVTSVPVGLSPIGVAVNSVSNQIYVANEGDGTVSIINGANNTATTVAAGQNPFSVAVNPMTGKAYAGDAATPNVSVIGGPSIQSTSIPVSTSLPSGIEVDPVTNQIYMVGFTNDGMTVIDGAKGTSSQVAAGTLDAFAGLLAVNQATNTVYAFSANDDLTVIAGATSTQPATVLGTIPLGILKGTIFPSDLAVNPATNRVYASSSDGIVRVVDGAAGKVAANITVGCQSSLLQVNPATNKVYVLCSLPAGLTVIDGTSNTVVANIPVGGGNPAGIAVNPLTNRIYVACCLNTSGSNLSVIDGASNTVITSIPVDFPEDVVVNPVSNRIYVDGITLSVIDGASNTVVGTVSGAHAIFFAVNPITNHLYFDGADAAPESVFVMDGISNLISPVLQGNFLGPIAVNPATNQVYVGDKTVVWAINEQQTQPVPLPVTIAFEGQSNLHVTLDRNPQFQFTASSNFQPFRTPIQNVYFQLDTWQGQWQPATQAGTNFTGQLSSVQPGNHVLYAYAIDGQDATLWTNNSLTGPIAAFPFTVIEQASTQMSLTSNVNPAVVGTAVTFTATVTSLAAGGPAPTGTVTFFDGTTVIGTATLNTNGQASFTTSTLSLGTHTIKAVYSGDVNFTGNSAQIQETIVGCVPNRNVAPLPNTQSGNFNSTSEVCFVVQSTKPLFFNCSQMMQRTVTVNGTLFQSSACDSSRDKSVALPTSTNGKYFFDVSAGNPSWSSIAFWNQN